MKKKAGVKSMILVLVSAGFLVLAPALNTSTWADPHQKVERGRSHFKGERGRHHPPRHGHRVVRPPHKHKSVWVGKSQYFYRHGKFYRRAPSGFISIRAPFGAVILNLPIGFHSVFLGGRTYYTYAGVYYQKAPAGYVVVKPPPVVVGGACTTVDTPDIIDGQVSVIAERLNVRSGPGLNRPVMSQVFAGDVLVVRGSAGGWWYVRLPDGECGWVMSRFTTTPVSLPANG